jgi:hypothetical protein
MITLYIKIKLVFLTIFGTLIGALAYLSDYYKGILLENKSFVALFLMAYVSDVVMGIWAHLKKKDFSFTELFIKGLTKIAVSFVAMTLFNAIAGVEGVDDTGIKIYLLLVGKLMNLFYLAGSAFNNMYYVTDKQFPPLAWMKKVKEFNKTLDPKDLTSQSKTAETAQKNDNV